MEGHSVKCLDRKTYWDRDYLTCLPCEFEAGHEVTPNCGRDDRGGVHELPHTPCRASTFNDGSRAFCQPCSSCPSGFKTVSLCSPSTDTQCQEAGSSAPEKPTTTPQSVPTFPSRASTIQPVQGSSLASYATDISAHIMPPPTIPGVLWAAPLAILITITLLVLSACVIYIKRKRGQSTLLSHKRGSMYVNAGSSVSAAPRNNNVKEILSPTILSAPLQTVLDNLDVLEDLVILLDPESHGVKNTKHLASHCSFPSSWITYTYSMKESKSPLKAVLEGVTSRNPEWTVEQLAELLRLMERNDALAVLAKLRPHQMEV